MTWGNRLIGEIAGTAVRALRALGPVRASNFGGALARTIGLLLPPSRIADANLRLAMPELDAAARRRVIVDVWDNLGRTIAELPHLPALLETTSGPGWELVGAEHIAALQTQGGPAIFFTGHLGNWEMLPRIAQRFGVPFATIYRPADNAAIDALILQLRQNAVGPLGQHFPKGPQGARQSLTYLKSGGYLGLLPDQKMNDGIECTFFGMPAMTAPAPAALAIRLRCPVIPAHCERIGPARLRLVFEAPLPLPATGDRTTDIAQLTQSINDHIEAWIRAQPGAWLWLHRRWPRESYPGLTRKKP